MRGCGVFSFAGALLVCLAGCPEAPAPSSSSSTPPAARPPSLSAPDASSGSADASTGGADEAGDAAPPSPWAFEEELPLEGTVRFKLLGTCRSCTAEGLELKAEADVEGGSITIEGEATGCKAGCIGRRLARGELTLRKLRPRMYTVRSELRVEEVLPLSLSSAKRAEWALHLMKADCERGVSALTGDEKTSEALLTQVEACFEKVSPETRFQTISAMLGWKNKAAYVPLLIESLGETKVAYLSARVLGRIEDRRALGPLIEALGSEDESLRWDASRSLEMITGEAFGQDQARWKAWYAAGGR